MRVTQNHYDQIKTHIDKVISTVGVQRIKNHRELKLGKDIEMRFRWDLFGFGYKTHNAEACELTRELYKFYNDDHIDTALKKYVKESLDI